jgi:tetratricopeptide (TPR) repeat protein
MLLSVFVLAAALSAAQEPPAPAPEAPAEAPPPVRLEAVPAAAEPLIAAGLEAYRKRRYTQAEIEFRKALEADPASAAAAFYLGYTYYKQAEPKRPFHPDKRKAAELFARAYELDPGFRPVWSGKR